MLLITRSCSFSVIRVSVDIKNNVKKDLTLLLFFLFNTSAGHAISPQKHLELPVVSYLLIELFYNSLPGVRTDGRSDGHVISKNSRMVSLGMGPRWRGPHY